MESSGVEGMINVSERTKVLLEQSLPNTFVFQEHKELSLASFNEAVKSFLIINEMN